MRQRAQGRIPVAQTLLALTELAAVKVAGVVTGKFTGKIPNLVLRLSLDPFSVLQTFRNT
jgi:hypothetical protein